MKHALAVAAALFALYAATSPRSVGLEDDGLFVLSAYYLGIEHPPGYPLFTLIGHLFTLLPFGSVAYRVHLASALFGALSCGALWLCARRLSGAPLPAYVAALGLGLSPTFWSQSIIAEVYTLNTFFLFALLYLSLAAAPPQGAPAGRWVLPALALVFGLSLANHYPLMLLAAPGIAVILWPRVAEIGQRAPALVALFLLGLTPYVWLIVRSWTPLPVSFYGPLESWREILWFLARSGYAEVDFSHTATWLDRLNYLVFFWKEFFVQFAIAGAALAAAGFAAQWRLLGARVSWGLTAAFLGPSVVLAMLLGFDYDALQKHVFHVYPLPAFGIGALWMALGVVALRESLGARQAAAAGAAALLLTCAVGAYRNLQDSSGWVERYAKTLLEGLPRGAVFVARGEWDLIPVAYYHLIEGTRPDLTLVQPAGLTLGNRMFHPLRITEEGMKAALKRHVEAEKGVVAVSTFSESYFLDYPHHNRWLYLVLDKTPGGAPAPEFDLPEPFVRFFEEAVLGQHDTSQWTASLQGELRRKYARLLAGSMVPGKPLDARADKHMEWLANDFYGALGLVEGLLGNPKGYTPPQAMGYLGRVRQLMRFDASKTHQARYFELRGHIRLGQGDRAGALEDLRTSVALWPVNDNTAVATLGDQYAAAGDRAAQEALKASLKR
jgi:Protein of unknown function (DUF2723)